MCVMGPATLFLFQMSSSYPCKVPRRFTFRIYNQFTYVLHFVITFVSLKTIDEYDLINFKRLFYWKSALNIE